MPSLGLSTELLIIGALGGTAFALLGLGLVIVFRVSGVINFAHGAVGSLAAYFMLFVTAHSNAQVGTVAAMLFGAILSGVLYLLFVERLRGKVEATIITLGMMITFQAFVALRWGTAPKIVPPISANGTVTFLGVTTSWDTVLVAVLTVILAGGLHLFLQRTRTGLHIEAVAQSPIGASLSGISHRRATVLAWMIAGGLAGLAGVLLARQQQLDPSSLSIFTVLALVPAFIGRLRSIGLTLLGGIALGAASSYLTGFASANVIAVRNLLPVVVVLLVLLLRQSGTAQGAGARQV